MVLSNSYNAEYGQASGAIVSVLTRSGTNQYAGRAFYYHRDDAWDATSGAARLVSPPETKSSLQQQILGGVIGGPLARDRAFFFGSTEQTNRDTEQFVTSAVLQVFRPGADARLPVESRSTLVFVRGDVNLAGASLLTAAISARSKPRARIRRPIRSLRTHLPRAARGRHAGFNQDAAVLHNHVFGAPRAERAQVPGRPPRQRVRRDRLLSSDARAENRPGILLGKAPDQYRTPSPNTDGRWSNAFTWVPPRGAGDHMLKLGVDASLVREAGIDPAGFDGIFTFATNSPFNPANAATYPTRYLRNEGNATDGFSKRRLRGLRAGLLAGHATRHRERRAPLGLRRRARHLARPRQRGAAYRRGIHSIERWPHDAARKLRCLLRRDAVHHLEQCAARRRRHTDTVRQSRLPRSVRRQPAPDRLDQRRDSKHHAAGRRHADAGHRTSHCRAFGRCGREWR